MTRRYILTGSVQGVGFRYFTQQAAARLNITGWVRNLPDGSVEAMAQGSEAAMKEFLQLLQQGPPWSRVESIQESEAEKQDFQLFTIER